MKLFGFDFVTARAFALLPAIGTIVVAAMIAHRLTPRRSLVWAVCLLLASDMWVQRHSHHIRMDLLTIFFSLLAGYLYLRSIDGFNPRRLLPTGAAAALAFLTHPMGLLIVLAISAHITYFSPRRVTLRALAVFLAPVLAGVAIWVFGYVLQDTSSFMSQFGGQYLRKATGWAGTIHHVRLVMRFHGPLLLVYLVYIAAGIVGLVYVARRDRPDVAFVSLMAFLTVAIGVLGHETGYYIYFVPWCIVLLAVLADDLQRHISRLVRRFPSARFVPVLALYAMVALNLAAASYWVWHYGIELREVRDYERLCTELADQIPDGSRVFLWVHNGNPYFCLRQRDKQLSFVQGWTGLPIDKDRYESTLRSSSVLITDSRDHKPPALETEWWVAATIGDPCRLCYYYVVFRPVSQAAERMTAR
jgi:4-amino-4-deoxy-L-arabinose transferase-like glycosyltransferase